MGKRVKAKTLPHPSKSPSFKENPDSIYQMHPSWQFGSSDTEKWSLTKEAFWTEILPFLKNIETRTWGDILIAAKKQNHSIYVENLNQTARKRLAERYIEDESIVSLHITGNHRLYGIMVGAVFNILWYDDDHGDNDTCVCRSNKKHT